MRWIKKIVWFVFFLFVSFGIVNNIIPIETNWLGHLFLLVVASSLLQFSLKKVTDRLTQEKNK